MNSPAKDFADMILESASTVSVIAFGTDVFVGAQPEPPLDCVTFFNTGGWDSAPNYTYDKPTVQALVRSSTYSQGYALAQAIKSYLHGKNGLEINSSRYIQILTEGDIHDLGMEPEKQHYEFSINFVAHRTPTT